ncbi:MAG: glucose-1-phosphate thymidylyltransferase, partial [Odoribacteraceae bacterium]|nr:glucose-1-phosphate thymidylyltransferase [Odoribacteraceae bacterium]
MILFDDTSWKTLRPLTLTRPVADLRVGILTLGEKWERRLGEVASPGTRPCLREKFPARPAPYRLWINGSICPTDDLCKEVAQLRAGELLRTGEVVIAFRERAGEAAEGYDGPPGGYARREYGQEITKIEYPYQIFEYNGRELARDFALLTAGRTGAPLDKSARVSGRFPLFAEEGAVARDCVINTEEGPVYLGRGTEVMEGTLIRGPLALCEHAVLKMGTRAYGATTVGPYCKCGGEVENVVLSRYSSKAHDGFLGHSVIGQWCNIGAGTSVSNLKNSYDEVRLWDYASERFRPTGLQFCGLIMGDHSKLGINMMINTGTVVGVSANLHGSGFPRNFVPSFAWGGASGFVEQRLSSFMEIARAVMAR